MFTPRRSPSILAALLALSTPACHLIFPFDADEVGSGTDAGQRDTGVFDAGQPLEAQPPTEAGRDDTTHIDAPRPDLPSDGAEKDAPVCQPSCDPNEVCVSGKCIPGCGDPGLLMYLPFDISLVDTAGGGKEMPLISPFPTFNPTTGKPAPSLVRGTKTTGFSYAGKNFNASAGTVVLWVSLASWSAGYASDLYTAIFPGGSIHFGFGVSSSGTSMKLYSKVQGTTSLNGFCNFEFDMPGSLGSAGTWSQLAFIWDTSGGGSLSLYWDLYGNFGTATKCSLTAASTAATSVLVGGSLSASQQPNTGYIDELMVYNRALTMTELQTIALKGCAQ